MNNENGIIKTTPRKLPTLSELHLSPEEAYRNDEFNFLLNQPPHESWLKKHPIVKVKDANGKFTPLKYLPVDKHEWLLTRIFQTWKREILDIKQIFNSIVAIVRVHYKHPVTGEWLFHDGTGAVAAQTDSGSAASDLSAIKTNAVQIGAPAAVSYALKDAAECLGKLFGRDLNKYDTLAFAGSYNREPVETPEHPQETVPITNTDTTDLMNGVTPNF